MTTSSKADDDKFQRKPTKATGRLLASQKERAVSVGSKASAYKQANVKVLTVHERIERLRVGIDAGFIIPISDHFEIPREAIGGIIGISPATMNRKIKARARLSPAESERLDRITQIEDEAERVFGDTEKAKKWLLSNNSALGSVPLTLLDTDIGTTEVRKALNAIAYGGVI